MNNVSIAKASLNQTRTLHFCTRAQSTVTSAMSGTHNPTIAVLLWLL